MVVTTYQSMPVYIKQLAKVVIGYQPRLGVVGRDGENDVVEGIVLMRKYEKSLPTSNKVQEKIDELNTGKLLPKGMQIVPFNQRTDLVHVTTHNVLHNLIVGMGLVIIILFVFLGDLTSAGIVALMIPLAILFSVSVLYIQGKSANLLSIGAVDFGIIVDSSVIIVENIYRHITAPRRRPDASADRPDHRGVARDRAGAVLLDPDHRLRVHPAVLDDGPGRGAVRTDGQHLRIRHLRRPDPGRDADPGALLVPVRQQEGGEGDVRRPDHEAAVPDDARQGSQAPLLVAGDDGLAPGFHHLADSQARGRVHAPAGGGKPLDPGALAADGHTPGSGADGSSAPRGDRLDSRDPGRDVARRPARRRHRRDQLLQPRVQRPADPDGGMAEETGQDLRQGGLAALDHPRGDPG